MLVLVKYSELKSAKTLCTRKLILRHVGSGMLMARAAWRMRATLRISFSPQKTETEKTKHVQSCPE